MSVKKSEPGFRPGGRASNPALVRPAFDGAACERPEYINGCVPDEGESLLQLAQLNEGSLIAAALHRCRTKATTGRTSSTCTSTRRNSGRPSPATSTPRPPRSWRWRSARSRRRRLPRRRSRSWGDQCRRGTCRATEDKTIPPATQRDMAERAKPPIVEIPASHASMVSQPDAVTELILTAVNPRAGGRAVACPVAESGVASARVTRPRGAPLWLHVDDCSQGGQPPGPNAPSFAFRFS